MSAQPSLFDEPAVEAESDDYEEFPMVLEYGSPEFEAWLQMLWDTSDVPQFSEWRCAWPQKKKRGKK